MWDLPIDSMAQAPTIEQMQQLEKSKSAKVNSISAHFSFLWSSRILEKVTFFSLNSHLKSKPQIVLAFYVSVFLKAENVLSYCAVCLSYRKSSEGSTNMYRLKLITLK